MTPFKSLIVPEEGWFGQPKYSTSHTTLCRFLLLYSPTNWPWVSEDVC